MTVQLTEDVWTPGTRPQLDAALRISLHDVQNTPMPERVWATYRPGTPPRVVLSARFNEGDEEFPELREYLKQIAPSSLLDYLYAVDSYYESRIMGTLLPENRSMKFMSDSLVDDFLKPSRGILLWQFQLEALLQCFGLSRSEAKTFRRHVNQKRPSILERASRMRFDSGRSLRDVIEERLLFEGVVPGQWRAARILFEARGTHTGN